MGRVAGGCEPAHHKTYDTAQQLDKFLERFERPYLESESRLPVFTELSRGRPSRKSSVRVDIYSDTRPRPGEVTNIGCVQRPVQGITSPL